MKPRHVRAVAKVLARLHQNAPTADERDGAASPASLARRWRGALQSLEARGLLTAADRKQLDEGPGVLLTRRVDAFLERHAAGRIRGRCAGLRPSKVRARSRVARIDAKPGAAGDVAEDLAVLSSAIRCAGYEGLAEQLLAAYALAADDYALYGVIDFYECLVICERAVEAELDTARSWLAPWLAARGHFAPAGPTLLLLIGRVASGKSTLAKGLVRRLGAPRVVADRVRDAVLGPVAKVAGPEAALERAWSDAFDERIYAGVLRRAEAVLASGRPCMIDACSPTRKARERVAELAARLDADLMLCTCHASEDRTAARLRAREQRTGVAEGSWSAIARDLDALFEEVDAKEAGHHVPVRTDAPLRQSVDEVLAAIGRARPPAALVRRDGALPRAVTFDCWNTLIVETDWSEAHRLRVEALHAATLEECEERPIEQVSAAFDRAWLAHMQLWEKGVVSGAREVARWSLEALELPLPEAVLVHLTERFQTASHSGRVVALDGARETLERLQAAGVAMALICDTGLTPGREVRRLLDRHGLLEPLTAELFSDEVGAPKPDRRIFRMALDALSVRPEDAVHVGDLRRTDVAGAKAVGMTSVRLRATHDDESPLPEADAVASSHAELLDLLGLR